MINLYTGTPGSGKSLHLARDMKNWMHLYKAPVIANFAFNADLARPKGYGGYLYIDNTDLTPEFLIWFSERYRQERKWDRVPEEHILLVIDECQLIFNAREWNNKYRKSWISFFTQHRKLGYRVLLVAQFAEMIDKQIRALVEYEIIHRKLSNVGWYGKILSVLAGGRLHIAIKRYAPLREKVGQEFFKSSKYLWSLYDSYNRFGDAARRSDRSEEGLAAAPERL